MCRDKYPENKRRPEGQLIQSAFYRNINRITSTLCVKIANYNSPMALYKGNRKKGISS